MTAVGLSPQALEISEHVKELQGSDSDASNSKSLLGLVSQRREQGLGEGVRLRVTVLKCLPLITAYTWGSVSQTSVLSDSSFLGHH